jgi:hypothetical protein
MGDKENGRQRGTGAQSGASGKPSKRPKRRPKLSRIPRQPPASGEREMAQEPAPGEPERAEIGTLPRGRPKIVLAQRDRDQAEALAGYGLTETAIAYVLGFSPDTLTRLKYEDEDFSRGLEKGRALARAKVGQALFVLATGAQVALPRKAGRGERADAEGYAVDAEGRRIMDQAYSRLPELGAIVWWEKTRGGMKEIMRFEVAPDAQPETQMTDEEIAAELTQILALAEARGMRPRLTRGEG